MNEVVELATREGFGLVVTALLPLFAVAAGAAIVAGWLGAGLGVRDAALGQCIRALAVIVALGLFGERIAASASAYARASWSGLGDLHSDPDSDAEPER